MIRKSNVLFCFISVSFMVCVFCPKVFKIMIINRQSEDAIIYGKINKGPIVYFFDGGSPSRHKQRFCIKWVPSWNISLKEVLCYGFGKLTQKRRFVFVTILILVNIPMY